MVEHAPEAGDPANVVKGVIDQSIFLGDVTDLKVKVGEHLMQARAHPSVPSAIGNRTFLRMQPQKCVAISAG